MENKSNKKGKLVVHTNPHPKPLFHMAPANVLRKATLEELEQQERDNRAFLALQKWLGKRFWKIREFVFTPEDEQDFSDLLKETFPTIRFLDKDALGQRKHAASGSAQTDREPELRYFDSLADPSESWFLCWLEPEGWQPKIGPTRFAPKARCILNEPPLQFEFHPMHAIQTTAYSTGDQFRRKDKPLPPTWSLPSGYMQAHPRVDDSEYKAFLGKAYRLVTKIATNKLIPTDPLTGWSRKTPKPRGENLWVGHHALAWCLENPRHFLDGSYRPAEEAEWRCRIPKKHPDYLTIEEAYERMEERFRFEYEKLKEENRKLVKAKGAGVQANSKKKPFKKSTSPQKPPKKKGG
ncbi:MAG: hypothetical protein WDZ84_07155 [Rhodovibrionaceae bacterium]